MKKMTYIYTIAVVILCTMSAFAQAMPHKLPPVDKVIYQVSVEDWVTTVTAKVEVAIDVSLDTEGLAKARSGILSKLQHIAKGDWQITGLERSQDQSGLERLSARAEARLPELLLVNLNKTAKSVSKPGETYRVFNVDFTPSLAEIEVVRETLRKEVYEQVKQEVARLNELYPNQQYHAHEVNFVSARIVPLPRRKLTAMQSTAATPEAQAPIGLAVSNKVLMNAKVVLSSKNASPVKPNQTKEATPAS